MEQLNSNQNQKVEETKPEKNKQSQDKLIDINASKNKNIKREEDLNNVLLTKSVVLDINKFSTGDYVPKKINKSIQLPINKNSSSYKKVKEEILSNIEDGMCELEYFNMDYAKEHIETALFYLKNIQE